MVIDYFVLSRLIVFGNKYDKKYDTIMYDTIMYDTNMIYNNV